MLAMSDSLDRLHDNQNKAEPAKKSQTGSSYSEALLGEEDTIKNCGKEAQNDEIEHLLNETKPKDEPVSENLLPICAKC